MVASLDQQIREWNQTCKSLRSKVRRLADRTAQMGLDYQEMNHEQFLAEVPELAEYLMNSVQDIYQSVGGRVRPPSPWKADGDASMTFMSLGYGGRVCLRY
ncbi:hypothetical protein H5410_062469 [Solanum commersonii]|uniref:Uncharacterized protein n=1 Tax=Solanum commersonii TaxID=4109 RepID=A0A9J5WBL7_SOLCO|nr:hypothetical protein H5410_062469 [Solanum commersonii]